ncbi:C-type lectin mannose-binding isoform-like isoform X2 [Styela clava]
MNVKIIAIICLLKASAATRAKGDGVCVGKWRNGRFFLEGDCQNPDSSDVIAQLKRNVADAKARAFLFTWYLASNGFYYKLFEDRLDYEKAKTNCQKFSANLASVGLRDSKVRRDLIKILLENLKYDEQVWIGVDDIETEGQFIWADGVIANPQSTDWYTGEPNDYGGNEDCGTLAQGTGWKMNDSPCDHSYAYLCERQLN